MSLILACSPIWLLTRISNRCYCRFSSTAKPTCAWRPMRFSKRLQATLSSVALAKQCMSSQAAKEESKEACLMVVKRWKPNISHMNVFTSLRLWFNSPKSHFSTQTTVIYSSMLWSCWTFFSKICCQYPLTKTSKSKPKSRTDEPLLSLQMPKKQVMSNSQWTSKFSPFLIWLQR